MDWPAIVRARLPGITGDGARDEEIVEELAQHLARRYEEARGEGAGDEDVGQGVRLTRPASASWERSRSRAC
jgi:hypothetical protein